VNFKNLLFYSIVSLVATLASGQDYDSARLSELPVLSIPSGLKTTGLPYKVDNSRTKYFPAIFTQYGYSCNQAATISVGFTYELNALRDQDAILTENRLPAFFTWNMMNSGNSETGVSYFESWDMVQAIGCPNWTDYGTSNINATKWMSGYYRYYRGMFNRIDGLYSIDVSTPAGLQTLKHWLYDHLGDYEPGGVASFQIASIDLQFLPLPEGTEEAGKLLIPKFSFAVGHAMTFVGYNDSVRYDFNLDGKYTNNLDTNGDGEVTMADWEIGALICVNTYGTEWGSEGRAFIPYRILPLHPDDGGIWMKSVVVAKPRKKYEPRLTLRTRLRYPDRSKLWITAGVSQDSGATEPAYILDQPVFHYQGGAMPMQGQGPADPDGIEIGIDATPLLGHIESGMPAKFFMVVCEQDPGSTTEGIIEEYSFNEYTDMEKQYPGHQKNIPIDQPYMAVPIILTPLFNGPVITTGQITGALAGQDFQTRLNATGGTGGITWSVVENSFRETRFSQEFPATFSNKILPDETGTGRKMITLPFDFAYKGKIYHEVTVTETGGILLEENTVYIPYGIELREMLGLHSAIFPFYSTEFQYSETLDGVYYQADPSMATLYWNASLKTGDQATDVNFAARLYPGGNIEFFYGDFKNTISTPWLTGLTGGSKSRSYYPGINATGISNGLNIRFEPIGLPGDFQLTREGILSCKPWEPGHSWIIPVCAEDVAGLKSYRDITLSTESLDSNGTDLPRAKIHMYPNPVTDRVTVEIESIRSGNLDLEIIDLTGRVLVSRTISVKPGRSIFSIDLTRQLSPGLYIIQANGIAVFRSKFFFGIPAG